ncbi:hypothetical protein MMRN_32200 [Mycobacterium marinum]|nr:hypothetical protein MMRN_32200 [Mycobacterium marinum]
MLVEQLNPVRSLTHHPLVQVMLAWQNFPGSLVIRFGLVLGDVQVTALPVDTGSARIDLAFCGERWTEAGSPLGLVGVEFRTDVFDAGSIEMLIERLGRVLVAMTGDVGCGFRRWMCWIRWSVFGWMGGVIGRCWVRRCRWGVDSGVVWCSGCP